MARNVRDAKSFSAAFRIRSFPLFSSQENFGTRLSPPEAQGF